MIGRGEGNPTGTVLVVGSAAMDVVAHVASDLQPAASTPARIRSSFGGVGRNVAENLARLGQPVQLITAVGGDRNGEDIIAHAASLGIECAATLRVRNYPTAYYMGLLDKKSRLLYGVDDMRVISALTPSYLGRHRRRFEEAAMVFMDCNLPEASIEFVVDTCAHYGKPLVADPASAAVALRLLPYLPRLYMVAPNSKEAGVLIGQPLDPSDREAALGAARHLASLGVDIALVTLAEFGVTYATSKTNGHIPSIRTNVVDPIGAGDAMVAAVMFALLNDIDIDDAVRLGVSAASLALRTPGTVYADLTLEKLYDQLPL